LPQASRVKKIVFFGPTNQKLWVFEVLRRSLGSAGANEEELTTCGEIWGQRGKKEGAGGLDKEGPVQERLATAGRRSPTTP
jgi:hypothetical protein